MWNVFAARGMGFYASTTGAEDVEPVQDFAARRRADDGTIAGVVTDAETGAGIGGRDASASPAPPDLGAHDRGADGTLHAHCVRAQPTSAS